MEVTSDYESADERELVPTDAPIIELGTQHKPHKRSLILSVSGSFSSQQPD
jgi:hypothetical protein